MKIGIITNAYTSGGYSTKQLESILLHTKHDIVVYLFLHNSRFPELTEECEELTTKYHCKYYPYGTNRGFGKSNNEGIEQAYKDNCDIAMWIPQDICFNSPTAFDDWIEFSKPYFDTKFLISSIAPKNETAPFSCCLYTQLAFEKLGAWDENFFPTMYEDIDLHRRASFIIGEDPKNFLHPKYRTDIYTDSVHIGMLGVKDLTTQIQQSLITGPLCQRYFQRKWGGSEGKEHYIHPFNDPLLSHKIEWNKREHPYGEHDRKDQGIARI